MLGLIKCDGVHTMEIDEKNKKKRNGTEQNVTDQQQTREQNGTEQTKLLIFQMKIEK